MRKTKTVSRSAKRSDNILSEDELALIEAKEKEEEEKEEKEEKGEEKKDEKASSDKPKKGVMPPQFKKNAEKVKAKAEEAKAKAKGKDKDDDEDEDLEESFDLNVNTSIPDHVFESIKQAAGTDEAGNSLVTEEVLTTYKTVIESLLATKLDEMKTAVCEQASKRLKEKITALEDRTREDIDGYLTYAARTWFEENELAVDMGIRNEVMESFVNGLYTLFTEHNINIPEEKVDIVEQMNKELDAVKKELYEQTNRNEEILTEMVQTTRAQIFEECSTDLTDVQRDKLNNLSKMLTFNDRDEYRQKLSHLKTTYVATSITEEAPAQRRSEGTHTDAGETTITESTVEPIDDDLLARISAARSKTVSEHVQPVVTDPMVAEIAKYL